MIQSGKRGKCTGRRDLSAERGGDDQGAGELGADEEGGGPYNGVAWLLKHHRPLIDAEYCLNEGGWGEMSKGRRMINTIQLGEKTFANFRIEVKNPGGHSSMPVKENAIYRLARALERIEHEGAVAIKDAGYLSVDSAFLVMEYLEGDTLKERLRAVGPGP